MARTTQQVDPLGGMFTEHEKKILRGRDPGQKQARDALVVRLADAFTFRRAPRGWHPPFFCFDRVALAEDIDTSCCSLPFMSQEDSDKANKLMEHVGMRMRRSRTEIPSGVTADELKHILHASRYRWVKGGRHRNLYTIIDSIPNNTQINKVVCIGLSEMAQRFDPRNETITIMSRCLAQHLAVQTMVSYLRSIVFHEIELFAADWIYDKPHKEALESFGFTVLDGSLGKQEHFVAIDDNTMLISFAIPEFESILPIISEYARPVAMIYDAYDYLIKEKHVRPAPSPVWSRVKYNEAWVTVPGPPIVSTDDHAVGDLATSLLPFYTRSTGRMLDDYRIAMNMFELDVAELASRFELDPSMGYEPGDSDKIQQRRFAGERSRLFVRKQV
ncbi:hypothetical protein F5Y10DRAFT_276176 [Nemania abortiva]|nr:hypothetical protein F5Y10DRAFT_276176 [Nemania abortiva]